MPKYTTKPQRLLAILDRYCQLTAAEPKHSFEAASQWALRNELLPIPCRTCTPQSAIEWERKLEAARA